MSQYLIYLQLPEYLAQWAIHHFGNPIEFPKDGVENRMIKRLLDKPPVDALPDLGEDSNAAVRIPTFSSIDVRTYNYLNNGGKRALQENLDTLLTQNLWAEVTSIDNVHCSLKSLIISWCQKNGISEQYEDTIAQKFYRLRRRYHKNGIFLGKNTPSS